LSIEKSARGGEAAEAGEHVLTKDRRRVEGKALSATAQPGSRRSVHRLSRDRRVSEIMEAARAVFEEKGFDDALISEIADRAEVVEGTIYRYFDNKRDLMVKVIEHWYSGMLSDYDEGLRAISGTRNRLRFMIWRHLKAIHDHPALCRLFFHFLRSGPDYVGTSVFSLNRAYTRRTVDIVREGIAAGEIRPDVELRIARDMIYGSIEHRTWAYLRGEGALDIERTADAITDLVHRGLLISPARPGTRLDAAAMRLENALDRLSRRSAASDRTEGRT
jgi:TetR/AcrR family transcriptional regulator, fatty acid metabolism regulator protein